MAHNCRDCVYWEPYENPRCKVCMASGDPQFLYMHKDSPYCRMTKVILGREFNTCLENLSKEISKLEVRINEPV